MTEENHKLNSDNYITWSRCPICKGQMPYKNKYCSVNCYNIANK